MSIQLRYGFKLRVISMLTAAVLCASGCKPVEDAPPQDYIADGSVQVILPSEEDTQAESKIVGNDGNSVEILGVSTKMATEAEETSAAVSESQTANAEIYSETEETVSEITEISAEATQISQSSALTLQNESPPEITATETETEYVAVSQTVSASETAASGRDVSVFADKKNRYSAINYKEQKGFWITYLEYAAILKNKSEKSFKSTVSEYFGNISDLGFNTVYVQVRAFGDAYYNSELFPSGEQFDGTIGTEKRFDALKIMVKCAHEKGLSIHAWVNPMRLMTTAQMEKINSLYSIKKWYDSGKYKGKYIVESGGRWYLNPAYGEVTDLIADGIAEIVSGYDVDGVQIDDYFYPTTDKAFDSAAYSTSGTELSLTDWRISNVNKMVKKLCKTVHNANGTVVFGISPQGSVENNYNELYADVRTWCAKSGYCDYILPQVYFGFENPALPYGDVIAQWNNMVKGSDVKLVIGLAAYKIGAEDSWAGSGKREWLENSDIISRQMALAKTLSGYGGVALYRYDSVFNPESGVAAHVGRELKNINKK